MTYDLKQKLATYRYRNKIKHTEAFKSKVRMYNATNYASLMENPVKLAQRHERAKWVHYYATDCTRDVRRLFM